MKNDDNHIIIISVDNLPVVSSGDRDDDSSSTEQIFSETLVPLTRSTAASHKPNTHHHHVHTKNRATTVKYKPFAGTFRHGAVVKWMLAYVVSTPAVCIGFLDFIQTMLMQTIRAAVLCCDHTFLLNHNQLFMHCSMQDQDGDTHNITLLVNSRTCEVEQPGCHSKSIVDTYQCNTDPHCSLFHNIKQRTANIDAINRL